MSNVRIPIAIARFSRDSQRLLKTVPGASSGVVSLDDFIKHFPDAEDAAPESVIGQSLQQIRALASHSAARIAARASSPDAVMTLADALEPDDLFASVAPRLGPSMTEAQARVGAAFWGTYLRNLAEVVASDGVRVALSTKAAELTGEAKATFGGEPQQRGVLHKSHVQEIVFRAQSDVRDQDEPIAVGLVVQAMADGLRAAVGQKDHRHIGLASQRGFIESHTRRSTDLAHVARFIGKRTHELIETAPGLKLSAAPVADELLQIKSLASTSETQVRENPQGVLSAFDAHLAALAGRLMEAGRRSIAGSEWLPS